MDNIGKATEHVYQQPVTTNTSDWHLFDSPLYSLCRWHRRLYEYEIFIDSCTDSMYIWLREKEMWLFDEVVDYVGIYGSKGAKGLSAFNAGLV